MFRCSNSASQAVSAVNGIAADWAQFRLFGLTETMRESISCSVALLPERVISPAYHTSSPTLKFFTALPTDLTMPLASQPSTFGAPRPLFCTPLCTLVSTGLIDTAFTSTRISNSLATGCGNSTAMKCDGSFGFTAIALTDIRNPPLGIQTV